MKRPIRNSLLAALALAPLAFATGRTGIVIEVARLLAVFFLLHFVLLLVVTLFLNLPWRLTPPPTLMGAHRSAGGGRRGW